MGHIADNVAEVKERIAKAAARAGRDPGAITLVAVSKTHPVEAVREALGAGITDFGENKVQEAVAKFGGLAGPGAVPEFRRHLVGHLQTNKAKIAVREFDLIHAVDSLRLATELDRHAAAAGRACSVLLEANVSGEESKFGFTPGALEAEFEAMTRLPSLRVEGLMTMAPFVDDESVLRRVFGALKSLSDKLGDRAERIGTHFGHELSMGMTNDFEIAVEEGSTMVRVGTAIFGRREVAG